LSLLNGITSEDVLAQAFGQDKILHAFCVATDAVREGTRNQFTKYGQIVFGDRYDRKSEKVEAVKALFDRNNVPYRVPEDILREQWWKFMMNVASPAIGHSESPYGFLPASRKPRSCSLWPAGRFFPWQQEKVSP
jgi:2-dehydropantoate 2-reductase